YYTDLAAWAAKKGYAHLRVDGAMLPTHPWPRLSRFQEHTIELPVAAVQIAPRNEAALRSALQAALMHGKGVVHVAQTADSGRRAMRAPASSRSNTVRRPPSAVHIFSTRRACPSCARSFADLDPRLFSFNSKHGWCEP